MRRAVPDAGGAESVSAVAGRAAARQSPPSCSCASAPRAWFPRSIRTWKERAFAAPALLEIDLELVLLRRRRGFDELHLLAARERVHRLARAVGRRPTELGPEPGAIHD